MNDDRLDQLIRSSLEWQAEQHARHAPTLATSARRVAERLGPRPVGLRSVVTLRPDSGRSLQLFLALLLLAALAAAVAVGSGLIRPPQPSPDLRSFGVGGSCIGTPLPDGVVFTVQTGEFMTTLYDDGALVTDRSTVGETKLSSITGIDYFGRRLSPVGVQMLRDRLSEARVSEGCRSLRTRESSGSLSAAMAEGPAELSWNPDRGQYNLARLASEEEEARIRDLAESLEHPETWLPDDAWIDVGGQPLVPERWLVFIGLVPTDYRPGDGLNLPNGVVLEGSDPRYAIVDLPGAQEPATFGTEMPFKDRFAAGLTERCGILDRADAVRLAESLDSVVLGADGWGDLFTTDLSRAVSINVAPSFPVGYGCAAAIERIQSEESGAGTTAPPVPPENVAGVVPCELMSESVDALLGGIDARRPAPASLRLGAQGGACVLSKARRMDFDLQRAVVAIHTGGFDDALAAAAAGSVLGDRTTEESIQGRPSWVNDCLASARPCGGAIVVWSDPFLIIIEFGRDYTGALPDVTLDAARRVVEDVLGNLRD
jgi:hypothetical protein